MCDFKVGDEVVCVDASPSHYHGIHSLILGATYRITAFDGLPPEPDGTIGLHLAEVPTPPPSYIGWASTRFRKVQRRNSRLTLEAFFKVPGGFEEPKRAPAKTPEHV